ncbi:hypothetical protein GYM29_001807 [Escherichia coli]|nr:hypothetical protein [Escherichia coli]
MWRVRIDSRLPWTHPFLSLIRYSSTPLLNVSNNDKQVDETKAEILFLCSHQKMMSKIFQCYKFIFL